ncbi:MAG: sigma-70 family RNA polymerase sigma factor [Phycisphaera sp.]|nr:sigma-70 family RNA polymerase sigma factor [Phycisphaera sp.]
MTALMQTPNPAPGPAPTPDADQATGDDDALFTLARAGDEQAMRDFVHRHTPWLRAVVHRTLRDRTEAHDVLQKTFLNFWQKAHTIEDDANWRNWLYTLARHAALDAGRRTSVRKKVWLRLQELTQRPTRQTPAHDRLEARELRDRILRSIAGLPEIYREPFVLKHLSGFSYQQIAQTLDMPVDTVETRLGRARRLLRDALRDTVFPE